MAWLCASLCVLLSLIPSQFSSVFADTNSCKDCEVKIPLEMALRLNTITDEKQLFREFVKDGSGKDDVEAPFVKEDLKPVGFGPDSVSFRFGGAGDEEPVERKAVLKPKPAGCIPELKSVSLRQSEDPWIYYWPSCTRVEQCGGCCSHQLLSCQPLEVEIVNYQVVVMEYAGNQLINKGKEVVSLEKHTKCKCDCITKAQDCNELQEFRKGECRCVCQNKDAEAKCNSDPTKHWNPDTCSCGCLNVFECSTGTYFNQSTCSCEAPDDSQFADRILISENGTFSRKPPPSRRRWPNYSLGRK